MVGGVDGDDDDLMKWKKNENQLVVEEIMRKGYKEEQPEERI